MFKKKTHPYTAAVGRAACLFLLIYFRTPGIAAELRAVITARGSRYFSVRAAWATASVCGFYYF